MDKKKRNVVCNGRKIPEDIIFDILKRLPAKTLMRFKCVCKKWIALILDPYFAESHLLQAQSRSDASYFLLYHIPIVSPYAIIPTDPEANISNQLPIHSFYKLGSRFRPCSEIVNGLMCVSNSSQVSILNITTDEQRQLPRHENSRLSVYFIGWFDLIIKNCKVLCIRKLKNGNGVEQCKILTLGSKSWRRIDCPLRGIDCPLSIRSLEKRSVSINGAIYWKHKDKSISFFDVEKEKFLNLSQFPEAAAASVEQITQVGEKFAMICSNTGTGKVNLWTLEHGDDDQVWHKQEIHLGGILISRYNFVGSTRTGEILLSLKLEYFRESGAGVLFLYNLTTGKVRKLEITRPGQPRMAVDALITKAAYAAVSNHVENILPLRCFKGKF